MHPSALTNGKLFFDTYASGLQGATVVDIGAQNVNGSLRDVMPAHLRYIGVDFVKANGVDVVLDDPYKLPFDDASIDIVVTSSCLEHSEMFWVTFLEILRVLRPQGLLYMNVPSNGDFHRYPVDCWRFYPDSGNALVTWARRNGLQPRLLESFVSEQEVEVWNDYVAVFVKDEQHAAAYPARMIERKRDYTNGMVAGSSELLQPRPETEDQTNVLYRFLLRRRRRQHQAQMARRQGKAAG
jgi:SAM-dependent methyltransferase